MNFTFFKNPPTVHVSLAKVKKIVNDRGIDPSLFYCIKPCGSNFFSEKNHVIEVHKSFKKSQLNLGQYLELNGVQNNCFLQMRNEDFEATRAIISKTE